MIDDLAKLVIENHAELFEREGKREELIRALSIDADDLEAVGTDVLTHALEGRELDVSERKALLDIADPFEVEDVVQALAELRAGNFQEAERLLERALGPDGAHAGRVGASVATMLFLARLPVFMR